MASTQAWDFGPLALHLAVALLLPAPCLASISQASPASAPSTE